MRHKVDPVLLARLESLGIYIWQAHQPESRFVENRRKLRVAEPGDPWRVVLCRKGVACWENGAQVGSAEGATLDLAVEAAIPTGLAAEMLKLERAITLLTVVVHAC